MSIAILGEWDKKSVPVKIEKAEAIITATGNPLNPNFQPPNDPVNPTLMELTMAKEALKTARSNSVAAGGGKVLNGIVATKEQDLDELMPKFVAFIQAKSGGDKDKILSSGLLVKKEAGATQDLTAVQGMIALVGESGADGAIDLDWDTLEGATSYQVRMREAVPAAAGGPASGTPTTPGTPSSGGATPGAWRPANDSGIATKSEMKVTGLVSGTRYEFQARGVNAKGTGGWSDPAFRVAP
jgi:hypothetical protein